MTRLLSLAVALVALLVVAEPGLAQATDLGRQGLGRAYWHVFVAYALVVVGIAAWVISIARRLTRVEARLTDTDA